MGEGYDGLLTQYKWLKCQTFTIFLLYSFSEIIGFNNGESHTFIVDVVVLSPQSYDLRVSINIFPLITWILKKHSAEYIFLGFPTQLNKMNHPMRYEQ